MSKEMKRKKALRLSVKRGVVAAAAVATVATVGSVGAEEQGFDRVSPTVTIEPNTPTNNNGDTTPPVSTPKSETTPTPSGTPKVEETLKADTPKDTNSESKDESPKNSEPNSETSAPSTTEPSQNAPVSSEQPVEGNNEGSTPSAPTGDFEAPTTPSNPTGETPKAEEPPKADTPVSNPSEGGSTETPTPSPSEEEKPKEETPTTPTPTPNPSEGEKPKEEQPSTPTEGESPKEGTPTTPSEPVTPPTEGENPKEDTPTTPPTEGEKPKDGDKLKEETPTTPPTEGEKPKEENPQNPSEPVTPPSEGENPKDGDKPNEENPTTPPSDDNKSKEENPTTPPSDDNKPKEENPTTPPTEGDKQKEENPITPPTEGEKPKEDTPKEGDKPKEDQPTTPPTEGEKPKEETPKEGDKPKEEKPTEVKPTLTFDNDKVVEKQDNTYNVTANDKQKVTVTVPEGISPDSVKIVQTLTNGTVTESQGTKGEVLPVNSTLELVYTDKDGVEHREPLGSIVDKGTHEVVAKSEERSLDLSVKPTLEGDTLPDTLTLTTKDGETTLIASLVNGVYHFDSSVLPEGEYDFTISDSAVSQYGRKFGNQVFHLKGKEPEVKPTPTPTPEPTPTPTPEEPTKPSEAKPSEPSKPSEPAKPSEDVKPNPTPTPSEPTKPVEDTPTPSVEDNKPTVPVAPVVPTTPTEPVAPITPTQPTAPIVPDTPIVTAPAPLAPSDNNATVGGNTTIINPQPQDHDNTNGNTNAPRPNDNINIGGVSNQTNYVEGPDKLTVGVSGGSVQNVKATVSSQDGTTELTGRVVNGSFVADNLPEKDGVYTVKVQVTDDKGQVSEKTITYAVNKNGSTYDWLNKDVNGAYYQRLSEDLKLSEHSTTRLDTSKTKFTFTLDGKVVTVDASLVKVDEKKEDDGSYTYTYTFNKNGFKENGVWSISVATVDVDGHASSSNASVQFQFVLDNIVPELKIEGVTNNGKYNTAKHQFKVLVKDNIGLARVRVLVNGKVYEFTREELLKGEKLIDLEHSDKPYSIEVEVVDLAGNTTTQKVEGITITATTAQALLGSDNFKFAVGALGLGFFGGLLAWWFAAVRKRKRKEQELEELRIGAHIVTEAEGLVSSGSGSASTGQPEETGVTETSELEDSGEVVSELLDSLKEEPVVVATPTMGDVTTDDSSTATLLLDETGVVAETSVLTEEFTDVLAEETSEQTSILDEEISEQTSVLEDEDHTSVLDEETSEQISVLDDAEKTSILAEETEVLADEKPKAKKKE